MYSTKLAYVLMYVFSIGVTLICNFIELIHCVTDGLLLYESLLHEYVMWIEFTLHALDFSRVYHLELTQFK